MPPVIPSFLLGLVLAPLAKRLAKPLVHGTIKTTVSLAMEMKKAAHQAGEEFQDIAAEVTAEMINAELRDDAKPVERTVKPRPAAATAGAASGRGD
ncbi:DUF5132 domain-containing protein [Streptomyces regalis]|uniref:DUF5132 domain-containing protein n=1 Tax=Streptomyces regalis TaxID=68262 RepID=A0A0X3VD84_9ACTN|nr:DUF5132 domain-containing protein [Streptomyces regalis]KUL42761.1 hypothetical protein ADL12_08925 [Streptomyces regalis]